MKTLTLCILLLILSQGANAMAPAATWHTLHLPSIQCQAQPTCAPIPGAAYGALPPDPPPTDRPAAEHADLNLALRGYVATDAPLQLVDIAGQADPSAPQLGTLLANSRPKITSAHRVRDWDWGTNSRGAPIADPPVTLIGLATAPGEIVRLPHSGYEIGSGYHALILYADRNRMTLKYTRDDNVVHGYTIHMENICVEPTLLAAYGTLNAAGRAQLPALSEGVPLGRAMGAEVLIAIRDSGRFMDPRSRKDWWR